MIVKILPTGTFTELDYIGRTISNHQILLLKIKKTNQKTRNTKDIEIDWQRRKKRKKRKKTIVLFLEIKINVKRVFGK
jgi:orotate phosphoribosyltransferase-like protein